MKEFNEELLERMEESEIKEDAEDDSEASREGDAINRFSKGSF